MSLARAVRKVAAEEWVLSDQNAPLLFDRLTAEWALAHACHASVAAEIERYRRALQGIASCATDCGSCQMLRAVAAEALGQL